MHRTICLLAALLALPSLGSDSPREYDDRTEMVGLEGTWRMEGNPTNVVTYRCGTWTITTPTLSWRGTYRIDSSRRPRYMERFYANGIYQGKTFRYIYQLDGDVLKLATIPDNSPYPQTFNDPGLRTYTFKRVR
jgi:uncharacterized protein (TIGR03067 family)